MRDLVRAPLIEACPPAQEGEVRRGAIEGRRAGPGYSLGVESGYGR